MCWYSASGTPRIRPVRSRWVAAVLLFQLMHRRLDAAHVAAQAARQPVVLAQAVEHGAADALHRVGLELGAEPFLVAVDGVEQAHHAVLDDVLHLHAGGQLLPSGDRRCA